jgi:hypothetical protein
MNALQRLEEQALRVAEMIMESEEIDDIFTGEFDTRLLNVENIADWLLREGYVEYGGDPLDEDEVELLARQWVKYYRRIARW